MLRDSMDALCGLINANLPSLDAIHVNKTPENFKRPSCFIMLATGGDEDLTKAIYQSRTTWQIVYFAPLEPGQNPDALDQLAAADILKDALMESMVLTGPSGTVYHILDVDGGPRDNEVYITVRLEAEKTRPEPQYDTMQEFDIETQ